MESAKVSKSFTNQMVMYLNASTKTTNYSNISSISKKTAKSYILLNRIHQIFIRYSMSITLVIYIVALSILNSRNMGKVF